MTVTDHCRGNMEGSNWCLATKYQAKTLSIYTQEQEKQTQVSRLSGIAPEVLCTEGYRISHTYLQSDIAQEGSSECPSKVALQPVVMTGSHNVMANPLA